MFFAKQLPIPAARPFKWKMKPLESAETSFTELPNGQLVLIIQHEVVRGVTPTMLAWWFQHLSKKMFYEGVIYPRYLVWHPTDHIHWELVKHGPDGSTGEGATFRIVEAFGADPKHYVDSTDYVEKCDEEGLSLVTRILGIEIFRLEHRFTEVEGGTRYNSRMVVGMDRPRLGSLFNKQIRPRIFSDESAKRWLLHNIEEVGNFEFFLPLLYTDHFPKWKRPSVRPKKEEV